VGKDVWGVLVKDKYLKHSSIILSMRTIIVIGTLHEGLTPEKELKVVLNKVKPHQLLVEIEEKDVRIGNIRKYPIEMRCAYRWAMTRKINVKGFDSPIKVLKNGITSQYLRNVINKAKELMKHYTWKEMNNKKNNIRLDALISPLIDPVKNLEREREMLWNIRRAMIQNGKVLIITGAGHLKFFEKNLKKAVFPLRK